MLKNFIRNFSAEIQNQEENFNPEEAVFEFFNTKKQIDGRGEFQFSKEQLERIAKNFNENVLGQEVHVNVNHDPEKKAVAWVKPGSLFVQESKVEKGVFSLYGNLYRFTSDGLKSIKEGVFRYFSIEYRNRFESFVGKTKKIFNDVITGIALTNSPAVKGMSPTFSALEKDFSFFKSTMEIKDIIGTFSAKSVLTKGEKQLFSEMISKFSEEEVQENQEKIQEIQDKEEPKPEEVKAEETPKTENHSEKAKTMTFAEQFPEEFAEMQRIKEENKERKFNEVFEKNLSISSDREIGFVEKAKPKVKAFCSSLSDSQLSEFVSLFGEISKVDLHEYAAKNKMAVAEEDDTEVMKKIEKMAMEKCKATGKSFAECKNEAIAEYANAQK